MNFAEGRETPSTFAAGNGGAHKKSRQRRPFDESARTDYLLLGSSRGSFRSSGCRSSGGRCRHVSGRSSSRCGGSSFRSRHCWSRSRRGDNGLFLLAASAEQGDRSHKGCQQKRLSHICPQSKGRTITGNCGTPPIPQSPNAHKARELEHLQRLAGHYRQKHLETEHRRGERGHCTLRNCINKLAVSNAIGRLARHGSAMVNGIKETHGNEVFRQ